MAYEFRALTAADISSFKELIEVFAHAFGDTEQYLGATPGEIYLSSFLAKDHVIVLVGLDESRVIGGLVAYELEKFERERKEVYIYDLAVTESYRRKGVGTGLVKTLRRIAAERGAYVIFVQADVGDDEAIDFYQSLGTREDVLHFDIDVE